MSSTATGPRVTPDAVDLTLLDPGGHFESVVLAQEVTRPRLGPAFTRAGDEWHLRFARPEADRLEYLLELDGELRVDPSNPLVAPGPFGDKSVIGWPEYAPPPWLDSIEDAGPVETLELRSRRLVARVPVQMYATPDPPASDAPLVVVHDGPEYASYSALTRFLDVMSWEERIPPLRAALIPPVDRNETYSASALYAAALVRELLPQIARRFPHGPRVGVGASLGALAMLHAHHRHPRAFDALLLQSGSFFQQRWDKHESEFGRYARITRFRRLGVARRRRREADPGGRHVRQRGGEPGEQLAVAEALDRDGFTVWLGGVRGAHNWTCWRDALDPHLTTLIEAVV